MRKPIGILVGLALIVSATFGANKVFASGEISKKQAEEIALSKSGGGKIVESKLDFEDGRKVYEIDIINGNSKYEMDVCVTDSKIYDYKVKMYSTTVPGKNEISIEKAQDIALIKTNGGEIVECKLDFEKGRKVYEIEIIKGNTKYEMNVCVTDSKIYNYKAKTYKNVVTNSNEITKEKAQEIALKRTNGGKVIKTKLDFEKGRKVYEIEIVNGNVKYEMDVCVTDSKIYGFKQKNIPNTGNTNNNTNVQTGRITMEQAKQIALARTNGGTIKKCKLDRENGQMVYEVEIRDGRMEYELDISVDTGDILKYEQEYDD